MSMRNMDLYQLLVYIFYRRVHTSFEEIQIWHINTTPCRYSLYKWVLFMLIRNTYSIKAGIENLCTIFHIFHRNQNFSLTQIMPNVCAIVLFVIIIYEKIYSQLFIIFKLPSAFLID